MTTLSRPTPAAAAPAGGPHVVDLTDPAAGPLDPLLQPGPAASADGRTRRAQRTRAAVVDALLALHEEGDLTPTAQRVAARAGVALRTVYGHFADMEALWLEAGRRQVREVGRLADVPSADLPFEERTRRFCASRAQLLEALLPLTRATRLRLPSSAQLRANWAWFVEVGDREVRAVFARELAELAADEAQALLDALFVVSTASAWDALRGDRRLDPARARAVLEHNVTTLLAPHARPDPDLPGRSSA